MRTVFEVRYDTDEPVKVPNLRHLRPAFHIAILS